MRFVSWKLNYLSKCAHRIGPSERQYQGQYSSSAAKRSKAKIIIARLLVKPYPSYNPPERHLKKVLHEALTHFALSCFGRFTSSMTMIPGRVKRKPVAAQVQPEKSSPKTTERLIPQKLTPPSTNRSQMSPSDEPSRLPASDRHSSKVTNKAMPSTVTAAARPLSAATQIRRERQARLAQAAASPDASSQLIESVTGGSARSSGHNNTKTTESSYSRNSMRNISGGLSSGVGHSRQPPTVKSIPVLRRTKGTLQHLTERSLPPIPQPALQTQIQRKQQRQQQPPRLNSSASGSLTSPSPHQLGSLAQRVTLNQVSPDPDRLRPSLHIQALDKHTAPLRSRQKQDKPQRPTSSDSTRARIGPWTSEETGHRTDVENNIDLRQYIALNYQPRVSCVCARLGCKGECRDFTRMVPSYCIPERRLTEEPRKQQTCKQSAACSSPPQQHHSTRHSLQQRRTSKQSSHAQQPHFWEPLISTPLRQVNSSSPHVPYLPGIGLQQPSEAHPNLKIKAALKPSLKPSPSHLHVSDTSPKSISMPFSSSRRDSVSTAASSSTNHVSFYTTDDPEIAKALRDAEEDFGEPLLPWDVEVIKASMERRPKTRQRPPSTAQQRKEKQIVAWHKDTEANRAASESPTTALAVLLKTLSSMPRAAQQSVGLVGIGSVGHRRPTPCKPATISNSFDEIAFAPAQRAAIYEDDGFGHCTISWARNS